MDGHYVIKSHYEGMHDVLIFWLISYGIISYLG